MLTGTATGTEQGLTGPVVHWCPACHALEASGRGCTRCGPGGAALVPLLGGLISLDAGGDGRLVRYPGDQVIVMLGGAAVAAVAGRGARMLARMLPQPARQMAASLVETAETAVRDHPASPFALLGFDPLELWHSMRHLYRPD